MSPNPRIMALARSGNEPPLLALARQLAKALDRIRALERRAVVTGLRVDPDGAVVALMSDGVEQPAGLIAMPRAVVKSMVHERDPVTQQVIRTIVTETPRDA